MDKAGGWNLGGGSPTTSRAEGRRGGPTLASVDACCTAAKAAGAAACGRPETAPPAAPASVGGCRAHRPVAADT